ncbi:hypothetical protein D9613_010021 [Agrocybe pediades]|uniref:PWI domain-containing protein n=1 Tax=Agrocybe pediades TaxID=84607 RepID=A0A8H4QXR7_9AGAR|nr:hypothetical protein D9613_010021 [Agrocybe pediades]
MADAGFFKGTSADQDRRFSDKELKLLKTMKFPAEFDKKVDMRKVNLAVIRPWIAKKIVELIGFEDEVVVEYAMGLLEDEQNPYPDPKKMQINLTGFLTKDTANFMESLWKLLLEAQQEVTGVPRTFVEQKKEEMRKAREGDSRAIDELEVVTEEEVEVEIEDVEEDAEEDEEDMMTVDLAILDGEVEVAVLVEAEALVVAFPLVLLADDLGPSRLEAHVHLLVVIDPLLAVVLPRVTEVHVPARALLVRGLLPIRVGLGTVDPHRPEDPFLALVQRLVPLRLLRNVDIGLLLLPHRHQYAIVIEIMANAVLKTEVVEALLRVAAASRLVHRRFLAAAPARVRRLVNIPEGEAQALLAEG